MFAKQNQKLDEMERKIDDGNRLTAQAAYSSGAITSDEFKQAFEDSSKTRSTLMIDDGSGLSSSERWLKAVAERKKQDSLKSTSGTAPATKFKLAPAWNSAFNLLSPEEEQACNNLFGIFKDISANLKKSSPGDIAVVTRLTSES